MSLEDMSTEEKMHDAIKESIIEYLMNDTNFFVGMDDLGTMTHQVYERLENCLINIIKDEISNYEKYVKQTKK